jgi:hypothetical protein
MSRCDIYIDMKRHPISGSLKATRDVWFLLELRLGRAIRGRFMAQSFGTTRSMAWYEIFLVVLARHEHEGRAVSKISA